MGSRNAPYSDICVAWYKALVTNDSRIFSAPERNILFECSKKQISYNMYDDGHFRCQITRSSAV